MNLEKSEKTKILFRARSLEMGGVVKVLIDLLENLPKDRLDISLMVNLFQGELRNEIPKDIKIIKIAKGKEDFSQNSFIQKIQLAFRLLKLNLLNRFPFLMNFYYKEKYDIEIAFGRAELEMVLNSPQKSSKKIAWVHWEFSHEPELNQSGLLVKRLKQFDHVVFCSENVRQQIQELYNADLKSTSVIYNVIHPDRISSLVDETVEDLPVFEEDLFTFVSVGRVKNGKGYPLLFRIHKKLWSKGLKHRIIIIGDGDKYDELHQLAKKNGLEDSFILLGNKSNPFPYMKNADFFILPTQSEAYPLSVKEALIMGLPALVTDVGGVSEIISDETDGLLMKYDEADISQKMERLITDKDLYLRLRKGAGNAAEKFETEEIYQKTENLFQNLNSDGAKNNSHNPNL